MKTIYFYETEIGKIGIAENGEGITNVYFNDEKIPKDMIVEETKLIKEAGKQLRSYLGGERKIFDLKLVPEGTDFMKKVWQELCNISYGKTKSYGEIAKNIENPKGARAVGLANNRNPIPIFVPCHRVIGANGKLVGYAGGIDLKKKLLELEGIKTK